METLTTEFMKQYEGCQVEIMHGNEMTADRHRCQIKTLEVRDAELHCEFEYVMKGSLGKPWVREPDTKPVALSLAVCQWNGIGYGRFAISSGVLGEMWVFYPKNHNTRLLADGTFIKDD